LNAICRTVDGENRAIDCRGSVSRRRIVRFFDFQRVIISCAPEADRLMAAGGGGC
jgi:hypothetical protein